MKKINSIITNLVLISILAAFGCIATMAQVSDEDGTITYAVAEEKRPFDFSDKFYSINGIEPYLIFNRPNGMDKVSVIDRTGDETRRPVRIIATHPAYNYDGSILFWNFYGELARKSFSQDEIGRQALDTANRFPIFVFPSETQKETNRQSNLIEAREGYFEKNPLGLGVIVEVKYTLVKLSSDGEEVLKEMAKRNGVSLDGTPVIKTLDEINLLTRMQLVTQTIKGLDNPSEPAYVIAKVMQNPGNGAITPDAFLIYVRQQDGNPLQSEIAFLSNFNCLQNPKACAADDEILTTDSN
jgi:hypothetical protein